MKNYAELKKEFESAKYEASQEIAAVIIQAGSKGITADGISVTLDGCVSKESVYGFIYNGKEVSRAMERIGYYLDRCIKREETIYVSTTNPNDVITITKRIPMFSARKRERR